MPGVGSGRGKKICPCCGFGVYNNTKACPSCGYDYKGKKTSCCGTVVVVKTKTCPGCGYDFKGKGKGKGKERLPEEDVLAAVPESYVDEEAPAPPAEPPVLEVVEQPGAASKAAPCISVKIMPSSCELRRAIRRVRLGAENFVVV